MNDFVGAARSLVNVTAKGRSLDAAWDKGATPLAREITYGVIRQYYSLGAIVDELVKKPLPDKHVDIRLLVMAGLYSIEHIRRPHYASVNDVVEAAAVIGKDWAKGLVNGVLRSYLRRREQGFGDALKTPLARWNHPRWMIEAVQAAWPAQWEAVLGANNQHAPMTLRVNLSRTSREEYLARLARAEIEAIAGEVAPTSVYLRTPIPVSSLPGFDEGMVSVQDEASQLAAVVLGAGSEDRVLDACAAPGGKTCHILEAAPGVNVTALDVDADRIRQIRQNLRRLSLECEVVEADLLTWSAPPFDRILLDAPCSATGIIRRHPDIKLLRRQSDIDKLSNAQNGLLDAAFRLLKRGGVLVYSTCSILPAENGAVVSRFIDRHKDAIISPIEADWGIATDVGRQLLPTTDRHDGFYYARIRRA
ncbi:MAG: 16S rRNA (cytosine(967)-C(5))-methyltransferase RsmB [Pseudomonadales bacterium]|nr:16S rRNA (cytosine(967)-C(5))-methyltransferase RsmB [Pseudomonadales bacterium]